MDNIELVVDEDVRPSKRTAAKKPRTPAQVEATRKALAALAEKRKETLKSIPADIRAQAAQAKIERDAAARAAIEGTSLSVKREIAEIKLLLAQQEIAKQKEAAAAVTAAKKSKKPRVRIVEEESSESEPEEVVVVRKKKKPEAAPAPAPVPVAAAPAPAPPAAEVKPKPDYRGLFSRH